MATRSATQEIRTITPPSSSHGSVPRGPWDFAVPIDNEVSQLLFAEKLQHGQLNLERVHSGWAHP